MMCLCALFQFSTLVTVLFHCIFPCDRSFFNKLRPQIFKCSLPSTFKPNKVGLKNGRKMNSIYLGPVVQSIISLTSSLVVKMLTALVSTVSDSQVFLLKM